MAGEWVQSKSRRRLGRSTASGSGPFASGRESCLNAVDTALGAGRTTDLSPEGRGTGGTGQTLAWSGRDGGFAVGGGVARTKYGVF
ncbi:hypothetical protein Aca07nite_82370 [Actinoplanes capillaceus]|uniref:Uncharacterized protein n=1 Tax=Actinoplanes campanulatus TaxID=113559 RepID=A0ABQ3WXD9_9ACTN|nr:hypothetical protein Aca07nite_82370 [Actinoplanes capillaceus]